MSKITFDKTEKKFWIVAHDCVEHSSIEAAREAAITLAKAHEGMQFDVCAIDSSFSCSDMITTHYK